MHINEDVFFTCVCMDEKLYKVWCDHQGTDACCRELPIIISAQSDPTVCASADLFSIERHSKPLWQALQLGQNTVATDIDPSVLYDVVGSWYGGPLSIDTNNACHFMRASDLLQSDVLKAKVSADLQRKLETMGLHDIIQCMQTAEQYHVDTTVQDCIKCLVKHFVSSRLVTDGMISLNSFLDLMLESGLTKDFFKQHAGLLALCFSAHAKFSSFAETLCDLLQHVVLSKSGQQQLQAALQRINMRCGSYALDSFRFDSRVMDNVDVKTKLILYEGILSAIDKLDKRS